MKKNAEHTNDVESENPEQDPSSYTAVDGRMTRQQMQLGHLGFIWISVKVQKRADLICASVRRSQT